VNSEREYSFRHAVMRDAAYQLQLPGDRSRLHALAFDVLETHCGGRAPEAPPLIPGDDTPMPPHPSDAFALELAEHARQGASAESEKAAGLLYLRRAAVGATRFFRGEIALSLWQRIAGESEGLDKGEALRRAGEVAILLGRNAPAGALFERAMSLFRAAGDRRAELIALTSLAGLHRHTGRMEEAERAFESALAAFRTVGDQRSECKTLGNLGIIYLETGRSGEAEIALNAALAMARELRDRTMEGITLMGLGNVLHRRGRSEEAGRLFEAALVIHREVSDRISEGMALMNLGTIAQESGRLDAAEQAHLAALARSRDTGDRRIEGIALGNLAGVYMSTRRDVLADASYRDALAIHREIGNRKSEGITLANLASLLCETSRAEEGLQTYQQGLAILREARDPRPLGYFLCQFSTHCFGRQPYASIAASWCEGARHLREAGDGPTLARVRKAMRERCAEAGVPPFEETPAAGSD